MTKDDFWRKYFAVYDVLNELRPYQDLLGSVKDNLKIKKGDLEITDASPLFIPIIPIQNDQG